MLEHFNIFVLYAKPIIFYAVCDAKTAEYKFFKKLCEQSGHSSRSYKHSHQSFESKDSKQKQGMGLSLYTVSLLFCSVNPSYCKHYNDLQWASRMNSCVMLSCRIVQCDCPEKVLCPREYCVL